MIVTELRGISGRIPAIHMDNMHNSKRKHAYHICRLAIMVLSSHTVLYNMHKSIFSCADCTTTIMSIIETRLHGPTVSRSFCSCTVLLFQCFTVKPSVRPV